MATAKNKQLSWCTTLRNKLNVTVIVIWPVLYLLYALNMARGCFQNLNLSVLKIALIYLIVWVRYIYNTIYIIFFYWGGGVGWGVNLKFHTKYLPHILRDIYLIQRGKFIHTWIKSPLVSCQCMDGLVQDCIKSSALAMELLQTCTKPSIYCTTIPLWQFAPQYEINVSCQLYQSVIDSSVWVICILVVFWEPFHKQFVSS